MTRSLYLAVLFLSMPAAAVAGTTGSVTGTIGGWNWHDTALTPVPGARVTFDSPSQRSTTFTDRGGHFAFVNLIPGNYNVIVVGSPGWFVGWYGEIYVLADCSSDVHLVIGSSKRFPDPVPIPPSLNFAVGGNCGNVATQSSTSLSDYATKPSTLLRLVPGVDVVGNGGAP
jgi:hypothetical protein